MLFLCLPPLLLRLKLKIMFSPAAAFPPSGVLEHPRDVVDSTGYGYRDLNVADMTVWVFSLSAYIVCVGYLCVYMSETLTEVTTVVLFQVKLSIGR
ncbi:hypothetical protein BDV36DRAFT_250667 [Aspergillus pseudocaelatus]|uniref:Uncharacterized protein n=1 Tax=Aspergillus pseudocaelatus TaxID=1825620 RepID=A0ABQ6WS54_9EURO|nr:hypothetical protein BDV36DRAFT_250667 [Aspergillus pseudocaelatus]